MTKRDEKLSEAEVKRVLELAMAQPKSDSGRLSLDELKGAASELGVPAEALDAAVLKLRAEQHAAAAQAARARKLTLVVLAVAAVVGLAYAASRPAPPAPPPVPVAEQPRGPFKGDAHVTVTTRVENDQPVDALPRVRVASHRNFTVFVNLSGLEHLHKMRTDLHDPSGAVVESDTVQLVSKAEPYAVWFKFHVPFSRKPGTYTAKTYADDQLIATTPIEVVIGNSSMQTAVNTDNANPVDPKTTFVRGKDTWVLAYLHFDDVKGAGANIEFTWTAPDGTQARKNALAVGEANGSWAMWDVMTLENKTPRGLWTVDASFEGTPIASTTFEYK